MDLAIVTDSSSETLDTDKDTWVLRKDLDLSADQ